MTDEIKKEKKTPMICTLTMTTTMSENLAVCSVILLHSCMSTIDLRETWMLKRQTGREGREEKKSVQLQDALLASHPSRESRWFYRNE